MLDSVKVYEGDEYSIGVHVSHCCVVHGCSYGEASCPVADSVYRQNFLCEFCSNVLEDKDEVLEEIKLVDELKRNLGS